MKLTTFILTIVVMALLLALALPAFAQDTGVEDPSLVPEEPTPGNWNFGLIEAGGEVVILPWSDEAKTLAAASLKIAEYKQTISLKALVASNFSDRNMVGFTFDVDVLEALSHVDKSGAVEWVQTNLRPSIGVGAAAPFNGLFEPSDYEALIHIELINIEF